MFTQRGEYVAWVFWAISENEVCVSSAIVKYREFIGILTKAKIMGLSTPGGQTNRSLTSSSTLDHELMEFSTRHWCFAIVSTLVAVSSLSK